MIASAAPCAPELQDAVEARLGCVVGDYLGLTEAWCVAPAADPVVRGSVGRLAPNLEAMIVDPDSGERLGPDERGELWIRGPQVMAGYVGVELRHAGRLVRDRRPVPVRRRRQPLRASTGSRS